MKIRIAAWASAGLLTAGFWALYFLPTATVIIANQPTVWLLARLSCPVVLASLYFGFGMSVYSVLLANAVTYALIGFLVETVRHRSRVAA